MKRIIFFALLLTFAATGTFAQEIQLPYPSTTALSYEKNKIYYEGERISKKDCQTILKLNAQDDIYRQYRNGLRMYTAGWSLVGTGLALETSLLGLLVAISIDSKLSNSYDPEIGPTMSWGVFAFLLFGIPAGATGLACEIAGIPLLCVGQKRMQQSIDTYNISLPEPQTAKNYWSIQPSNNGIGLAYHF